MALNIKSPLDLLYSDMLMMCIAELF